MGSIVVRADRKAWVRCPMPPNTLRVHTEYVFVLVGAKVLWVVAAETMSAGRWRIFRSPPVPCLTCGGGDRWCRYLSYTRAFGDGPRHFEPWSSDGDDTLAGTPLFKLPHHTNGRTFDLSTDLKRIAALHGGSLVVLGSSRDKASHDSIP
ncbi:hypothetical protein TNCV_4414201 [Trichonephila clavipes]|uniref:Uncharacterized protein n=1 Tax=Trichonephila clavipes TaxID=2585209 RepID=A0A8X6S7L3_TRICX|nr:hypothetical protein TNCV_4414201 [Trichonephila clavipes]